LILLCLSSKSIFFQFIILCNSWFYPMHTVMWISLEFIQLWLEKLKPILIAHLPEFSHLYCTEKVF
jgi:hypothetical protein